MARIPLGNFGNSVPQPGQTPTAGANFGQAAAEAAQRLGNTGMQLAGQELARQTEQQEALARSRAGDGLLDYEVQSKTAVEQIRDRVQTGQLPYADARGELDKVLNGIKAPDLGGNHPLIAQQYQRGVERQRFQAVAAIDQVMDTAQRSELKANFIGGLDRLGRLGAMPDAPLDDILAKVDAQAGAGRLAGLPEADVAKTIQAAKDGIRYQRAQGDLVAARRDVAALDAFQTRLESGDLSGTLPADKRIALLRETDTLKWQAQNQAQHAADKREKTAERAITTTTRQIEAGVPITADGWTALRATVEGTPFAGDFNALVEQERKTQQVLRMPIAEQEQYVQQREAQLAQGGTLVEKANLDRIRATIGKNKAQLENEPLLATQRLFGRPVAPLNPEDLLQPGGAERAAAIFTERTTTLAAMRKQFGPMVGAKPLLPQESSLLVKALDAASPSQATELFSRLRAAVDDEDTYRAVMQQVAPDSPVKARAGTLAALDRPVTTETRTFGADVRTSSTKVAQTMLVGEQIMNRTKGQKAADGKAESLFAPPRAAFEAEFADVARDLYRSRPGAQEADLQAALAYYVGKAAETGRLHSGAGDIDSALVKQAMTATLGSIVNFNGHGNVKAPMGMSGGDMQAQLRAKFADTVKAQGLPPEMAAAFEHYGAVNYRRDGQFMLTLGGVPVIGKGGAPVILDLDPPPYTGTRYRRAEEGIPR